MQNDKTYKGVSNLKEKTWRSPMQMKHQKLAMRMRKTVKRWQCMREEQTASSKLTGCVYFYNNDNNAKRLEQWRQCRRARETTVMQTCWSNSDNARKGWKSDIMFLVSLFPVLNF